MIQQLSHYRIVEQIGAGGMGVVYRAHDELLGRDVAIKVLPEGTIADPAVRSRFRKEALALAKLDHPNIATIFEFASQEQIDFLVTAYVPGLTLDAKLASRALPQTEVVDIGIQLVKGLAAAHEKGVVHRDLKPGNLRITPDGLLKILDFGLAQFVEADAATISALTRSTEFSGTLPYMSPEQLGAKPVDARSDIWATGAVLYEMATGSRPFRAEQPAVLINEILNKPPKPPRLINPQISQGLENVILQALMKEPAGRYQTANELRADLERVQTGAAPEAKSRRSFSWFIAAGVAAVLVAILAGFLLWRRNSEHIARKRRSVAVLGFKNLSGSSSDAWISPALSEMLTTELGAGGKLRTIPGENVARMKADLSLPDSDSLASDSLAKIYRVLGSDVVVLGSYLNLNGEIRIDLRVQEASGEQLATVSDQGPQAQFFELVKRVGGKLRQECGAGELLQQDLEATRALEPSGTEAIRLYSTGLEKFRRFDALGARDLLERAIAAEPNYALAHAALASVWSQLGYDAKAAAESKRALDLSQQLPREDKLSIEAGYYENNHNWDRAVEIYRSLWTFFPDNLDYGLRLVSAQIAAGRGQDALATARDLHQLPAPSRDDPRIDLAEGRAASALSDFRHELAAIARARDKAKGEGSQFMMAQALMEDCWANLNLGELEQAKASGEQARGILAAAGDGRGEARSLTCIANVLADQGKLTEAKNMHQQALALAKKIGAQKDIAGALINLGNVTAQENLTESTANYREAIAVATAVGDTSDALSARNNIAANLIVEGQLQEATAMLQGALQNARDLGDQSSVVIAQVNLGTISVALGNFAESRKYLSDALAQSRQLDLKSNVADALAGMGDLEMTQDNLDSAEKHYREALTIRTQIGEQGGIATSRFSLANLALEKGDANTAVDLARQAIEEFHNEHNPDQEAMTRAVLLRALLARGELAAAQNEEGNIRRLRIQDQSGEIAVEIAEARLTAANGSRENAIRQLKKVGDRARDLRLPASEYEARLARLELETKGQAPAAYSELERLKQEAQARGFRLIAHKAQTLLNSVPPLNRKSQRNRAG
ncbi:MAG TPA: tetratricopeptide repeat protein [Terriglobales bacterium]